MVSIRSSDLPAGTPVYISQDGHVPEMDRYVSGLNDVTSFHHANSCYDHPNSFPSQTSTAKSAVDQYGNPREAWVTCAKHHWWWMMQHVWSTTDRDALLFLEEDYTVAPTLFSNMLAGLQRCSPADCFGVVFEPKRQTLGWVSQTFRTGPMVIRRDMWNKIWAAKKQFCMFDDYNWDWSVVHLMSLGLLPYKVISTGKPQVSHDAGSSGMHHNQGAVKLSPFVPNDTTKSVLARPSKHRGYGGWAHPEDHEHCLKGISNPTSSSSRKLYGQSTTVSIPPVGNPIADPNSCDKLFGESAVSNQGPCLVHSTLKWAACAIGPARIDPSKIEGSIGNEDVSRVLRRDEQSELLRFRAGSIAATHSWPRSLQQSQVLWRLLSQSLVISHGLKGEGAHTTLLVKRGAYANPCMIMASLYNVFVAVRHWGLDPQSVDILWLDGHAKGTLDPIWGNYFARRRTLNASQQALTPIFA